MRDEKQINKREYKIINLSVSETNQRMKQKKSEAANDR